MFKFFQSIQEHLKPRKGQKDKMVQVKIGVSDTRYSVTNSQRDAILVIHLAKKPEPIQIVMTCTPKERKMLAIHLDLKIIEMERRT